MMTWSSVFFNQIRKKQNLSHINSLFSLCRLSLKDNLWNLNLIISNDRYRLQYFPIHRLICVYLLNSTN